MNEHRRQALLLGLGLPVLLVSMPLAAIAQAKWKGSIVKEGDVTVVKNPKEPLYRTPVLELKEDLSIGGPDAQGDDVFGQTRSVVVDDAGTIYVLDEQASDVKVFDASGKHVRTIGRKGQGPGELEFPMTLSLNRAAGELVVQLQTRGLVFFKTDGTFLRQQSLKGLISGRGRVDSRGQVYVLEIALDETGSRYVTKKLAPDASLLAIISETPAPAGKGPGRTIRPFLPVSYFLIDRADRFIYGYPEDLRDPILRARRRPRSSRRSGGSTIRVPVTAEEKAALEKQIPPGMKIEIEFPKDHPAYSASS